MNDPQVEIIRSSRRKRTLQADVVDGRIRVRVPAGMAPDEERRHVERLVARLRRRLASGEVDLVERTRRLARRYRLPEPVEITWSDRQHTRWGSCSPANGRIRVSRRLADMPRFVLDYVLVHELAHLQVAGHGPDFQALADRYELAERAKGYLMAVGRLGEAAGQPYVPWPPPPSPR